MHIEAHSPGVRPRASFLWANRSDHFVAPLSFIFPPNLRRPLSATYLLDGRPTVFFLGVNEALTSSHYQEDHGGPPARLPGSLKRRPLLRLPL